MPDSESVAALKKEISDLEVRIAADTAELATKRRALLLLDPPIPPDLSREDLKYSQGRPWKAMVAVLKEHGSPMSPEELMERLVAGGALLGKKRGLANLRMAINICVESGKLKMMGKNVGLPDWHEGSRPR